MEINSAIFLKGCIPYVTNLSPSFSLPYSIRFLQYPLLALTPTMAILTVLSFIRSAASI